jgi:hypothetical protein
MAECRFRPLGAFDTGSDVTSRLSDRGFSIHDFVDNHRLVLYRFDIIIAFLIAESGREYDFGR